MEITRPRWRPALLALALLAPADAAARDFAIRSFDGTRIEAHFFPAKNLGGGKAPTVLYGPGWGNGGATNDERPTNEADGTIGLAPLRGAGYNVLTWDPRGFGGSGGEAKWDSPHYEARDVQALMDVLAGFPEAQLDGPGDPRVGMAGASYGGGIQWATAAIDGRVDAITPVVAWHSLVTSLYKGSVFKAGWGSLLCGFGTAQGTSTGLVNPDGVQAGSMDAHMYSICSSGLVSGRVAARDTDWLADRGPGVTWMDRVRAPALVVHGTVDTLFTLAEATENFRVLRANGVPARMLWFCGGHGSCRTSRGAERYFEDAILRWLDVHVKKSDLPTGPRFEWIDQNGAWHQASDYPLADDGVITATGSGTLQLTSGGGSSGAPMYGTPATNGVDVPIPALDRRADAVGAPTLELDYEAQGSAPTTHAYAQIVDEDRGIVVGGQVTPLPLSLDEEPHTLRVDLEPIAYVLTPSSRLRLEIVPATAVYGSQRSNGRVELKRIALTLPLGKSPAPAPPVTPAGSCKPRFAPRSVRRRASGRVRIRPVVRCDGKRLRKRVRISDGRRTWSRRTGRVHRLRVRPRARRLTVGFRHGGRAYRARVRIRR